MTNTDENNLLLDDCYEDNKRNHLMFEKIKLASNV